MLADAHGQVLPGVPVRVFPLLKARRGGLMTYTMTNTGWVPFPEAVKTAEDG